jgi:hypothetical protein
LEGVKPWLGGEAEVLIIIADVDATTTAAAPPGDEYNLGLVATR